METSENEPEPMADNAQENPSDVQLLDSEAQPNESEAQLQKSESQLHKSESQPQKSRSQLHKSESQIQKSGSQLQKSGSQLHKSDSQLQKSGSQLHKSDSQLQKSGSQLQKSGSQLHKSDSRLQKSGSQLQKSGSQLHKSGSQLQKSGSQLQKSQSQLHENEAQRVGSDAQLVGSGSDAQLVESEATPSVPHTPNPSEHPDTEDYSRSQPAEDVAPHAVTSETGEKQRLSSPSQKSLAESGQEPRAKVKSEPVVVPIPRSRTSGDRARPRAQQIRPAEVMYRRQAFVIQNPLLPPKPCREMPKPWKPLPGNRLDVKSGPDRCRLAVEKQHYRDVRLERVAAETFNSNPAALAPLTATRNPHKRGACRGNGDLEMGWREKEERLKDYRDHLLAEKIGYETLVGNLLYIDIPQGRDINRSWDNFLSDDVMEWGFPYYKGSRERPRVKQREPYLAHQLKEKLWKYPKTRIFHSLAED